MTNFKKTAILSAVAGPALLAAQGASAVMIQSWDYQVDSAFANYTPDSSADGAVTGSDNNGELGDPTKLSWGVADQQSSIEVTSDVDSDTSDDSDNLVTNNGSIAGATFTHNNFDINDPNNVSLESFDLQTRLMLTAAVPDTGDEYTLDDIVFQSLFTETDNQGDCVEGSLSSCDDIFVLANDLGEQNADGSYTIASDPFTIDDFSYTVFLDIADLTGLTDAQCAEADANSGCVGFLTQEGQVNNFTSSFRIVSNQSVPEPATLGLLGAGLFGMGYARRRNRKS